MHYQFPNKKSKKNLNKVYLSDEQKNISKDTPESLRLLYVALNCLVKARHGGHCNVEYSNKFSKKKIFTMQANKYGNRKMTPLNSKKKNEKQFFFLF